MTTCGRPYGLVGLTALLLCAACNENSVPTPVRTKEQRAISSSSDSVSREDKARQLYGQALSVRKGRGDEGLRDSMEIFKTIIQEYPETSAARETETQLAASKEVVGKLEQLRENVRSAEEVLQAEASGACPESVTYDLCRRIRAQSIETTAKMQGILESCSLEEATAILQKCTEMVRP